MLKKLIVLFAMVTILAACGGGSSSTGSDSTSGGSGSDTGSGGDAGSGGETGTVLDGVWVKSCGPVDPSDPETLYDIVTATFSGNNFTSNIKNYLDAGCSIPMSEAPNPIAEGVFSIGAEVTTSSGVVAQELDSHVTRYSGADFDTYTYTIFTIEGNVLYMGDDNGFNDGTTSALRPTAMNYNRAFYK
ncbi:hypothetical protein [Oceanospirillum linum]|uniref:Uncharacterized protein n=1 Tax=Oceanospirillum linum TaxID=966 RepID=A0A1T1HEJ9_OCELI|nr:hypothetical protein [Oceanospirillum linum]OOV88160.1 hypothetical protein BTA35_0201025 [Oceanospirillum linum]SEF45471.1 hypothetical protein SAMN04489856_101211 [Oleiphilus messinensis]SMP01778.1 hypothetical protein SAMN06264348_101212 [Oceanospirillum linum]